MYIPDSNSPEYSRKYYNIDNQGLICTMVFNNEIEEPKYNHNKKPFPKVG